MQNTYAKSREKVDVKLQRKEIVIANQKRTDGLRQCANCQRVQKIHQFYRQEGQLHSHDCKMCCRIKRDTKGERICRACKCKKPLSDYRKNKNSYSMRCLPCISTDAPLAHVRSEKRESRADKEARLMKGVAYR